MKAALHEDYRAKAEIKGSSDRNFGFVFAAVFLLLALAPLRQASPVRVWALAVSASFAALALVRPTLLRPLNRLWMKLGLLLGRVTNPIFTSLIFFGVLVPTALALRLQGKDRLLLKRDPNAASYWIPRTPPGPAPESMANQF
jgi:hypothetical protein